MISRLSLKMQFTRCSLTRHLLIVAIVFVLHPKAFSGEQSISYDLLLNTSVVNCTATLPASAVAYMASYTTANPNVTQLVPQMFLRSCIRSIPYDRRLSAFSLSSNNTISFAISLSQLLSLDFEGHVLLRINLDYQWIDNRLRWSQAAIPMASTWSWPYKTLIHHSEVWVPSIEVLNCDSDDCSFQPHNNTYLTLKNNGKINMILSKQVETKCHLNFTMFPFDQQNCSLNMALENNENLQGLGLSFNFSVWGTWLAYATFTEDNDGWVVTALDVRTDASSLIIFNEITPDNWNAKVQHYPSSTAVIVSAVFTRAGNYYVLNLFFPLLVIVIVAISTVFMSGSCPEKAELQMECIYRHLDPL